MDRRGFFKFAGGAAVAAALAPQVIEVARTYFLPPAGGWAGAVLQRYSGFEYIQLGATFDVDNFGIAADGRVIQLVKRRLAEANRSFVEICNNDLRDLFK